MLFVGVGPYTDFYHELIPDPKLFETVDWRKEVAIYGSPYKHFVCDFVEFPSNLHYYHVAIYGVLNFKPLHLRRLELVRAFIAKGHEITLPRGTLMFGPNRNDQTTEEEWSVEMSRPPLLGYETLYCNFDGFDENCVWWGRKP